MLRGEPESIDLLEWRNRLLSELSQDLKSLEFTLLNEEIVRFKYPVERYPEKVSSINLDKVPEVRSRLLGIKGQYLIFEAGVLNVRSHSGYEINLEEIYAGT